MTNFTDLNDLAAWLRVSPEEAVKVVAQRRHVRNLAFTLAYAVVHEEWRASRRVKFCRVSSHGRVQTGTKVPK